MKQIIIILVIILVSSIFFGNANATVLLIPEEAIRMRVIPNSNDEEDIIIKNKVKNELQNSVSTILSNTKGITEARNLINQNLETIDKKIEKVLKNANYAKGYKLNYALNYFPEKEYKGVKYEEGYYESILVTLGEGKGDNWWCVLFPPLCLIEATETEKDEVEYKFFIKEIIDKFL